jgi:hypothetical protein
MNKNMGMIDRLIRVIIAIVIVILYFTEVVGGLTGLILIILAAVFALTSFVGTCPLYLPFGINTLRRKENTKPRL